MANFLDTTEEVDQRLREYALRLGRIESHLGRGEKRAARAQLTGFLEELVDFSHEIDLPLETIVVGAQLGFFSGGELLRGRIPGVLLGATVGWLYGQQAMRRHRLALEAIAEAVASITIALQLDAADHAAKSTEEIDREPEPISQVADRVTLEVDRD